MRDLNKHLFFRTEFTIARTNDETDLLWEVVMASKRWMTRKWGRRGVEIPDDQRLWTRLKFGGYIESQDSRRSVRFNSSYLETPAAADSRQKGQDAPSEAAPALWACNITELFEEDGKSPREWTSEVSFAQASPDEATVAIIVSYEDRSGFLGPLQDDPDPSVPNIVRLLLGNPRITCRAGNMNIGMSPRAIDAESFSAFWEDVANPKRELPVVYISPRYGQDGTPENLVDPDELADIVGPNALVVYSLDAGVSRVMMETIGNDALKCTGGAVRIYLEHPDFGNLGDSRRHRYFKHADIEGAGSDTLVQWIARSLSQDAHPRRNTLRKQEIDRRRRRMAYASDIHAKSEERIEAEREKAEEYALQEGISAQEKVEQAEAEADAYAEMVDKLEGDLREASAKIASLETALSAKHAKTPVPVLGSWPPPRTEIVRYFLGAYSDRIDLTDAAWTSLESCETEQTVLWNALNDLAEIAWPLYDEGNPDVEGRFNDSSTFEFAKTEGKMTKKDPKLAAGYEDEYKGNRYEFMAHIRKGGKETDPKFIRIYLRYIDTEGKIVISRIGRHRKNYSSRKA